MIILELYCLLLLYMLRENILACVRVANSHSMLCTIYSITYTTARDAIYRFTEFSCVRDWL
jgi:hypothetical protein